MMKIYMNHRIHKYIDTNYMYLYYTLYITAISLVRYFVSITDPSPLVKFDTRMQAGEEAEGLCSLVGRCTGGWF